MCHYFIMIVSGSLSCCLHNFDLWQVKASRKQRLIFFPEHLMFNLMFIIFLTILFTYFFHNIPQVLLSDFPFFSQTNCSSLFSFMYIALGNFSCSYRSHLQSLLILGFLQSMVFFCLHGHIRERCFGGSHTVPS